MSARQTSASPEPAWHTGLEQDRPGLAELALDIARTSVAELDAEELLRRTCIDLTELGGLAGCAGVLFASSTGSVRALVASHPAAGQLTRLLQQLGEGIGSAAIWSGRDTAIEDLTTSARVDLAEAAGRVGLPVTAAVALRGSGGLIGCLQLFGSGPHALTERLLADLAPFAEVLGTALDNAEAYQHSAGLVAHLTAALDDQRPIEQAKGMLTERHQIDLDAAYRMLREQARRRNMTVHAVAAEQVAASYKAATPVPEQGGATHPEQTDAPAPRR
ncbi:GAF and ANTAR domain-containing protein [Pseudonocardia acaciae]|uniref:GAF and ANTAR domain-containing protein n=1 Tax=Pseudonocardia acaciae TaxID=551276 RepID=UPI00048F2755|nr:GAF and ANTAR domain-containing protein [Pseudonocardia acaciae]